MLDNTFRNTETKVVVNFIRFTLFRMYLVFPIRYIYIVVYQHDSTQYTRVQNLVLIDIIEYSIKL